MSGNEQESAYLMSNRRRNPSERVQDGDDPSFAINQTGTGVQMTWKTIVGMIGAAIAVTTWCLGVTNTAAEHTRTLAAHGEALKDLNAKLDAVLWKSGLNPKTVVREASEAGIAAPSRP
jgi:hypothetical protein